MVLGAILSNALTWILTPIIAETTNVLEMTVSVPVYALSILSTAAFTWGIARVIAKYDSRRESQIHRIERALQRCKGCGRSLVEEQEEDEDDSPTLFDPD
jgi:hypothetical protein